MQEATRASPLHFQTPYLPHEQERLRALTMSSLIRVYSKRKCEAPKREETVGIIIRRRETNPSLESRETEDGTAQLLSAV